MSYFWSQTKFFKETTNSNKNWTVSEFTSTSNQNITWNFSSIHNFLHFAMRHSVLCIVGCDGTQSDVDSCCTTNNLCGLEQGNCEDDSECIYELICGTNNCGANFPKGTNCCRKPFACNGTNPRTQSCCSNKNRCYVNEGHCSNDHDCHGNLLCGSNNCNPSFPKGTNCCYKQPTVGGKIT